MTSSCGQGSPPLGPAGCCSAAQQVARVSRTSHRTLQNDCVIATREDDVEVLAGAAAERWGNVWHRRRFSERRCDGPAKQASPGHVGCNSSKLGR